MKILHICQTPIAGACHWWSEAFKEAGFDSTSIAMREYGDGRKFPSDHGWPPDGKALMVLADADLIFCHQGRPYQKAFYPRSTPTIFIYHSQPSHVYRGGENRWPWAVIGQYQTKLYPGAWPVPNLVPLGHPWFQPAAKPADYVRIAYSPSNTHLKGCDDKGYDRTVQILTNAVQADGIGAEADIIWGKPFDECMDRKRTAHIVVDECMTGAYHRSSLEGLALGCVTVNGCDDHAGGNVKRMTGGCGHPFAVARIDDLRARLDHLIELGPSRLAEMGRANRKWMESAWQPAELIERNIKPLMDKAMGAA